jgi:hypothetical protein
MSLDYLIRYLEAEFILAHWGTRIDCRYAYPWWREKVINSEQKRLDGLCPLTPEEAVLFLQALGFNRDTQIYIAAGEIYGSMRRMQPLYTAYPNTVSCHSFRICI